MKQLSFWDDCWVWGNPLDEHPHSYARYFHGNAYSLLREVVKNEWLRTYALWRAFTIDTRTDKDELLEVFYYFKEATEGNYKNVHEYIAARIGCSRQRVARLLSLVSIEIYQEEISSYGHIRQNVHSINERADTTWKPSPKEVRRKMAGIKRICAGGFDGCLEDSTTGKVPLCLPCHHKVNNQYGSMPHWLLEEIKRIENEHYKAARDACYEDHHGTMSIDELESYLDAG